MYRSYEDPYKLQKELDKLRELYCNVTDEDVRIDLAFDIAELEDRLRFAWDDDEHG